MQLGEKGRKRIRLFRAMNFKVINSSSKGGVTII